MANLNIGKFENGRIERVDLLPPNLVSIWQSKFPVGKIITDQDVAGNTVRYLVQSLVTDPAPTFHPENQKPFTRVIVTLVPQ